MSPVSDSRDVSLTSRSLEVVGNPMPYRLYGRVWRTVCISRIGIINNEIPYMSIRPPTRGSGPGWASRVLERTVRDRSPYRAYAAAGPAFSERTANAAQHHGSTRTLSRIGSCSGRPVDCAVPSHPYTTPAISPLMRLSLGGNHINRRHTPPSHPVSAHRSTEVHLPRTPSRRVASPLTPCAHACNPCTDRLYV